jgi:hypothetical protein
MLSGKPLRMFCIALARSFLRKPDGFSQFGEEVYHMSCTGISI